MTTFTSTTEMAVFEGLVLVCHFCKYAASSADCSDTLVVGSGGVVAC